MTENLTEPVTDRTTERLSGLTFMLCCYAMSVWTLAAVPVNYVVDAISAPVLAAAVFLCVVYLADSLMTERSCRLNLMVVFNALCAAAGAAMYRHFIVIEPAMPAVRTTFAVVYAGCMLVAWFIAWSPVKSSTVIACFDWMAVLLIVHIAFRQLGVTLLTVKTPGICAAAMAFSLISTIRIRLNRTGASGATVGNASAGQLFLGVIVLLILILAVLLTAALSGMLHGLSEVLLTVLTAVGSVLMLIVNGLYRLLEVIVRWLLQWFVPGEELEVTEEASSTTYESGSSEIAAGTVPLWFYVLLTAAVIALVVVFFRKIRGLRIEGHAAAASQATVLKSGGLCAMLKLWIRLLRERIDFGLRYRRSTATPAGMLIWCERHYRSVCPRQAAESAGAYLRRLAAYLDGSAASSDVSAALRELADLTERVFYAPSDRTAAGEKYPELLKRLKQNPASLRGL